MEDQETPKREGDRAICRIYCASVKEIPLGGCSTECEGRPKAGVSIKIFLNREVTFRAIVAKADVETSRSSSSAKQILNRFEQRVPRAYRKHLR